MGNKIAIAGLLIAIAGVFFAVSYYILSGEPETEAALEEPQEIIKAEPKERSPQAEQPTDLANEPIVPPKDYEKRKDTRANDTNTPPINNEGPPSKPEQVPNAAFQKQVSFLYEDLFKELALPEEQRKRVEDHLAKSMKSESEFDFKLLDPNVPAEEVLREQERMSQELQRELGGILSQRDQDVVTKHQNNLPKKMQKEQILMLVDSLNLQGEEKENVRSAVERAVQNGQEEKKRVGQYTAQDIVEFRKQFNGAKPGDPEFMRASVELSANRVKGLLKDLEHLPQYEAIKKQMETPIEMMRQGLKQQQKPHSNNLHGNGHKPVFCH